MELVELTYDRMEAEVAALGLSLPLEQTGVWASFEDTIEGRAPWGVFRVEEGAEPKAFVALIDYATHGYHYLRAPHGPVWLSEPSAEEERAFLLALKKLVHERDHRQVFVRLAVLSDDTSCEPVLSTLPYNQTVIMDLNVDEDIMLQGLKSRGRRDVRKAQRESPAVYADETERATVSFAEYYEVMQETAERDDFVCAPQESYEKMIRVLSPAHCRVYAGRVDGQVVTWTIATLNGTRATRYYGASRAGIPKRSLITDGLIFFESGELARLGATTYDMMGIGNDFAPSLKGLNTFKTKYSQKVVDVAPDRDLPIEALTYGSLAAARKLLRHDDAAAQKKDVSHG